MSRKTAAVVLLKDLHPVEYFCRSCGQLRLSVSGCVDRCGNCGSVLLIISEVNTLNKPALKKWYDLAGLGEGGFHVG